MNGRNKNQIKMIRTSFKSIGAHARRGFTLVEMMVGRRLEASFPPKPTQARGEVVLQVRDIQLTRNGPHNSFDLHKGEILGFAGLVDSVRTELALGVIGALPVVSKDVLLRGQTVNLSDPAHALANGIGLLPESRKSEGLIVDFTIRENISLNNLGKYEGTAHLLDRHKEDVTTEDLMKQLSIKAPTCESRVINLSGGNQQKVLLARWMLTKPDILFLDEPTRGIDVGAKSEIYKLMRLLTGMGKSLVMISSELPEVMGMSDRILVMHEGKLKGAMDGHEATQEKIMSMALT